MFQILFGIQSILLKHILTIFFFFFFSFSFKETLKKDLEVHYMLFGTNNKSHSQKPDLEEKDGIWELIHNQTEMETLFCPKVFYLFIYIIIYLFVMDKNK